MNDDAHEPLVADPDTRARATEEQMTDDERFSLVVAEIFTGAANPSGRLPISFPTGLAQHPRPELPGLGTDWGTPTTIHYEEGADVGYRWFARRDDEPLFPFGHGLTYTTFDHSDLRVTAGETVTATCTVTNTGERSGVDVPQLYLTDAAGEQRTRLLGFARVELEPGESRDLTITAEPRTLARYDGPDGVTGQWRIDAGTYRVAIGRSAISHTLTAEVRFDGRTFGRDPVPA